MENSENGRLTERKRAMIFISLVVSGIASSVLSTAMTTALPGVVEYFGISTSVGQWITSGYSLAMGMIMPLTAFLITRFPTKRLYLRYGMLHRGPSRQYLRGEFRNHDGGKSPAGLRKRCPDVSRPGGHHDNLSDRRGGTMMGTYGLATTAAPIVAPTIAGLMIDAFGWKSIFYVAMVIMTLSFVISIIVFENVLELRNKKFDVLSFVESIVAFGGITLGTGNITAYGSSASRRVCRSW